MADLTVVKISELCAQGTAALTQKILVEQSDGTFTWLTLSQLITLFQAQFNNVQIIEDNTEISSISTNYSYNVVCYIKLTVATTSRAIALAMTNPGVCANFVSENSTAAAITVVLDSTATFIVPAGARKEVNVLVVTDGTNKYRIYIVGGTAVVKTL